MTISKALSNRQISQIISAFKQTLGNCNSNCNVIVMNYIFEVMESNL